MGIFSRSGIALVLLVLATSGVPQDASAGRFATFKQLLRERNISLSEEALVAALGNTDPHVRYVVALVLAEDKATDAIPAIAKALTNEKVDETRVNIALALAQLGDERGLAALREGCSSATLAPILRMYAAKYLVDLQKDGCLSSVEDILQSAPDAGSRILALSELPRVQHVSGAESERIFALIVARLSDKDPSVRIAASHALAALRNMSAVSHLQEAIAAEPDEGVRSTFQADLRRLQEKGSP